MVRVSNIFYTAFWGDVIECTYEHTRSLTSQREPEPAYMPVYAASVCMWRCNMEDTAKPIQFIVTLKMIKI